MEIYTLLPLDLKTPSATSSDFSPSRCRRTYSFRNMPSGSCVCIRATNLSKEG
jgi:hypothetical protein